MTPRIGGSRWSRTGSRAEETRLALGCSPAWAEQRTWLAHQLATRLPVTRGLLAAGRISAYVAGIAVTESSRLTEAECVVFEDRVFPRGESQTPARFRKSARLVAAVLHPQHLEEAHRWAKKATDVTRWVDGAGMASVRMHAPAPESFEVWDAINTEAWAQARAAKTERAGACPDRGAPGPGPAPLGPHPRPWSSGPPAGSRDQPRRPRPRRPHRPDRARRSPTAPTSRRSPSPRRRSSWSTVERVAAAAKRPGDPGGEPAGVGQPVGVADRAGPEGAGRGDHRPGGAPRGEGRTRRVGGVRDHPREPGQTAGRGRLVAAGAPRTGRGVAAGLRAQEIPTHPQAPRPPARSRAGLPRAVLQRPTPGRPTTASTGPTTGSPPHAT